MVQDIAVGAVVDRTATLVAMDAEVLEFLADHKLTAVVMVAMTMVTAASTRDTTRTVQAMVVTVPMVRTVITVATVVVATALTDKVVATTMARMAVPPPVHALHRRCVTRNEVCVPISKRKLIREMYSFVGYDLKGSEGHTPSNQAQAPASSVPAPSSSTPFLCFCKVTVHTVQ